MSSAIPELTLIHRLQDLLDMCKLLTSHAAWILEHQLTQHRTLSPSSFKAVVEEWPLLQPTPTRSSWCVFVFWTVWQASRPLILAFQGSHIILFGLFFQISESIVIAPPSRLLLLTNIQSPCPSFASSWVNMRCGVPKIARSARRNIWRMRRPSRWTATSRDLWVAYVSRLHWSTSGTPAFCRNVSSPLTSGTFTKVYIPYHRVQPGL